MNGRPFTTREVYRIGSMLTDGATHAEIADALGRPVSSVQAVIYRNGWRQRRLKRWGPDAVATLRDLRARGMSWETIARAMGRTRHACAVKYRRLAHG